MICAFGEFHTGLLKRLVAGAVSRLSSITPRGEFDLSYICRWAKYAADPIYLGDPTFPQHSFIFVYELQKPFPNTKSSI